MSSDPLLDAIIAAPEDDAPRLVWADREGGERGELVVIQCALAKDDLDPAERKRLAGRENTLLRNARTWAALDTTELRPRFVRGFVESTEVAVRTLARMGPDLFARAPLLREIDLTHLAEDVNRHAGLHADESWAVGASAFRDAFERVPLGRVTSLRAVPSIMVSGDWADPGSTEYYGDALIALIAVLPALAQLRDLSLTSCGVTPAAIPNLARLRGLASLRLSANHLDGGSSGELVSAIPSLRRLTLHYNTPRLNGVELERFLASPFLSRLRYLNLSQNHLSTEERLRVTRMHELGGAKVVVD